MKIAVTYDNGQVFQHFGQTERFKVYQVENNRVTAAYLLEAGENGHGALAGLLANDQVGALICGGIGGGAKDFLAELGIKLYPGVCGSCDQAVEHLLAGKLSYNPGAECDHHDHEGSNCGGHEHSCGRHGQS